MCMRNQGMQIIVYRKLEVCDKSQGHRKHIAPGTNILKFKESGCSVCWQIMTAYPISRPQDFENKKEISTKILL